MPVTFVIAGAPRTGSTLLVRTLNNIDGVRCHGELLGEDAVRGYEDGFDPAEASAAERQMRSARLLAARNADTAGFLRQALSGDDAAIGMKILYHQLLNPRWATVVPALLSDSALRIIHLTRANGLRRYVSEAIAKAGGPIHSGAGGRAEVPMQIHVDLDTFRQSEAASAREARQVEALLAGHSVHTLSYESLAADTPAAVAATCAFLGVRVDASRITPALEKVGASDLRAVVSNYDELLAHSDTRALALRD